MEDKEKSKNKKLHGCFIVLLVIVTITAVAGSLLYAVYWYIPGNTHAAALMLENGKKNFEAEKMLPEDENGLKEYMDASSKMDFTVLKTGGDQAEKSEKLRRWVEFGIDKSETATVKKFLAKNEFLLQIVAKGDHKKFIIPSELPVPSIGGYTHVKSSVKYEAMLEQTADFLLLYGKMKMNEAEYKEAAACYFSVLGLSRGSESLDKAHLLRWQLFNKADSDLIKILGKAKDGDPVFRYIMDAGRKLEPELSDMTKTLECWLFYYHYLADDAKKMSISNGAPAYAKYLPIDMILQRELKIFDLEILKLLEVLNQSGYEGLKYVENRLPDKRSFFLSAYSNEDIKIKNKCALLKKTYLNGLITAAALRQYKSDKGFYPEKTEDLTPAYLNSLPLNYVSPDCKFSYMKKGPEDVILYCFGPDLTDQGGNEKSGDDVVFLKTKN